MRNLPLTRAFPLTVSASISRRCPSENALPGTERGSSSGATSSASLSTNDWSTEYTATSWSVARPLSFGCLAYVIRYIRNGLMTVWRPSADRWQTVKRRSRDHQQRVKRRSTDRQSQISPHLKPILLQFQRQRRRSTDHRRQMSPQMQLQILLIQLQSSVLSGDRLAPVTSP